MAIYTDTDGNTEWTAVETATHYTAIVVPDGHYAPCGVAVYRTRDEALDGEATPECARTFPDMGCAIAFALSR